ncbi:MAG TPA: response regulator [Anaerolineae bacterium]|nr:response regulator [Anaerolineae bacterium]
MTEQPLATPGTPAPTILIVDDNANNLATLSDYLLEYDFEILIARSGDQGLARAQVTHPAMILLDIVMPGMDGFEVCRRLKADAATQDIPVIFLTALGETEHKVKAFQLGAVDYITKPLQREEVLARVLTHLRLRALTGELEHTVQARTAELVQVNRQLQYEITERERAEAALRDSEIKYRNLVEHANDGVVIVQDEILQYCNSALAKLQGYAVEEMLGRPIGDFVAPDALSRLRENQRRRRAGELVPQTYELAILHKDGHVLPVELNVGQTIYQGQPADQVFIRDIAARKQMEAALQQRIIALTRPLDDVQSIAFTDLFDLAEIQAIQDAFAKATGVASLITTPEGVPLTRPSNFRRLCQEVVRKTPQGLANCMHSDAVIARANMGGPTVQPCLSAGLWSGGAAIMVGEQHMTLLKEGAL